MKDLNTIGVILGLIGIAIIIVLFGYLVVTHFGLLGVTIYIAGICIFLGSIFMVM